jgi:hypothetical protein
MIRIVILCLIAFLAGYVFAKIHKDIELNKNDKPEPNEDLNSWREKHK